MAKIIRLKTPQDTAVESLAEVLEMAKRGELINYILAAKRPDGEVVTSWANADVVERNELVSHLQIDVVYSVIEAHMDRLVERV